MYSSGQNGRYTTHILSIFLFNQHNFIKPIYLVKESFSCKRNYLESKQTLLLRINTSRQVNIWCVNLCFSIQLGYVPR